MLTYMTTDSQCSARITGVSLCCVLYRISGSQVFFEDGTHEDVDTLVCCTGYKIHVPFLDKELTKEFLDDNTNELVLYKNVFSPTIGSSLAFIGFVQPASGGIVSMSEVQARWFAQLCLGKISLPTGPEMTADIQAEKRALEDRYYKSTRHTIQRDPIVYNDEVTGFFGAKPQLWRHPLLAFRLIAGSGGSAQWRLQGPGRWSGARAAVKRIPVTPIMTAFLWAIILLLVWAVLRLISCAC